MSGLMARAPTVSLPERTPWHCLRSRLSYPVCELRRRSRSFLVTRIRELVKTTVSMASVHRSSELLRAQIGTRSIFFTNCSRAGVHFRRFVSYFLFTISRDVGWSNKWMAPLLIPMRGDQSQQDLPYLQKENWRLSTCQRWLHVRIATVNIGPPRVGTAHQDFVF